MPFCDVSGTLTYFVFVNVNIYINLYLFISKGCIERKPRFSPTPCSLISYSYAAHNGSSCNSPLYMSWRLI